VGSGFSAFGIVNEAGIGPLLLVCDHASNSIPPEWADLGLEPSLLGSHIAWDPGAFDLAVLLSQKLDAPLVHGGVSRLLLDCNRPKGSPTLIPEQSDGIPIPGNSALGDAERARRIAAIWTPFHDAVDGARDALSARRAAIGLAPPAIVSVHSFTPVYGGRHRPFHAGILFDRDRRLADALLFSLGREPGITVRANEPYSPADDVYFTLQRHGEAHGLMTAMIEIRNDELQTDEARQAWARRLGDPIAEALSDGAFADRSRRAAGTT
jgi:predicted N-formylglutamate amidohydrolase